MHVFPQYLTPVVASVSPTTAANLHLALPASSDVVQYGSTSCAYTGCAGRRLWYVDDMNAGV